MAANKNNQATEQQIVEQTGLTTIPGLPTPTPPPATEQQIAEQTGLTNILGLPSPGSVYVPTPESTSTTRPPRPPKTEGVGSDTDNSTKPSSENAYYDIINAMGQKPEMPQSTDKSAGAGAANGTQYSWDKMGTDQAQNQYQQEALKAKQDALANRQTIEQNALEYQQQADMMQYANNQNAEKVGWTGGYVLDQNRQMQYLKSSIQAQMYGAMELQKYGYDSALAAARLSYDLNQKEFAHKYYQDAVNVAITEAQITGTYFSAETRDMMSQLNMADQEIGMYNEEGKALTLEAIDEKIKSGEFIPTAEQSRALEVRRNIESWYKANGVSTTGIKTLAAWESEQAMAQQWAMNQWEMYQAALSAANNKDLENPNVVIELDKEGNPIYNGTQVQTKDFGAMSNKEITDYANTGSQAKSQVTGYVNNMFEETILNQVKTSETYTNEKGESIPIINEEKLKEAIANNKDAKEIANALGEYSYSTEAGDTTVDITLDKEGNIKVETHTSKAQQDKQEEQTVINQYKQTISDYKAGKTNTLSFTAMTQGNDALNTYGMKVQEGKIGNSNDIDDDFDIDIGGKNYDLDVDWEGRSEFWGAGKGMLEKEFNDAVTYLGTQYPGQSKNELVIYNGRVWFYSEKMGKWGLVQTNTGGNKLLDDLKEAANGTEPQRWK